MVVPNPHIVNKKHPLHRPTKVKSWAGDLTDLVKNQMDQSDFFDDFDFGKGKLTRKDIRHSLEKMRNCGSLLEFRANVDKVTGEAGAPNLYGANFCKQSTICPICASRIQDKRKVRYKSPIELASEEYRYVYLVTATLKPSNTWLEGLTAARDAWQSLRLMGQSRFYGRSPGEFGKVRAGLAKIELKRGSGSGLPHAHIHALLFTNEPLDFRLSDVHTDVGDGKKIRLSKLSKEWFRASDGRGYNIKVDVIKAKPSHLAKGMTAQESIFEQSREVLKYCTKFDSNPGKEGERMFARDFAAIKQATHGRRTFFTYGDFRSIPGDDYQGSDMPSYTKPAIYAARWRGGGYSELLPQNYPVFEDNDKSLAIQRRVTIQNQYQGFARKLCGEIIKERDRVTSTVTPLSQNLIVNGIAMAIPEYLRKSPNDKALWEEFLDQTKELLKRGRIELRESLIAQSLDFERFEYLYDAKIIATEFRFRPVDYMDRIVKSFLEVLQHPLGYIPAPS